MDIQALRKLMLFEQLSDEQLKWVVENSTEITASEGERLTTIGDPAHSLFVLLEGEWRLTRLVEGIETTFTSTSQSGSWFGGLPVVDGVYSAVAQTLQPSRLLKISNEAMRYMLNNGFGISEHIISGISTGARNAEAIVQQREKMAALGKLSAGLAHELNNPAAAAQRATGQMREVIGKMQTAGLQLNRKLNPAQLDKVSELQREAVEKAKTPSNLSTLDQSEREDELIAWLEDRDVPEPWNIAPTLVTAGLEVEWLDRLAQEVDPAGLGEVLGWLEASLTVSDLLNQLENSTGRISTLIKAVKEYSYMDQASVQEIDIHNGLESTLTMLAHKLKGGVTVTREYDRSLPRISAAGSELNQVWTNLIDNAVDAMHGKGQLWIRTRRKNDNMQVEIADNGPGIPPEIQSRIFEPFFTTKGVGEGSGLGLDIAYRVIVTQHKGALKVESQPGDTRFIICLPISV